jgi:hypothetical protein
MRGGKGAGDDKHNFLIYGPKQMQAVGLGIDGMTKAINGSKVQLNDWIQAIDPASDPAKGLPLLRQNLAALAPELITSTQQIVQHTSAVRAAAQAMESDAAAGVESMAKGLAGLIGGRRAQAGVEAVWETARGIALIAEGIWPPNPAALLAGGQHLVAAAEYAKIAGTGSHDRAAGAGAGAGSSDSSVGHGGGVGGGRSGSDVMPQTLASGAGGAGSRFSGTAHVVVFGTDHELQQWVAGAVNGAVNRGITVTATSSQRGAPVGH